MGTVTYSENSLALGNFSVSCIREIKSHVYDDGKRQTANGKRQIQVENFSE